MRLEGNLQETVTTSDIDKTARWMAFIFLVHDLPKADQKGSNSDILQAAVIDELNGQWHSMSCLSHLKNVLQRVGRFFPFLQYPKILLL